MSEQAYIIYFERIGRHNNIPPLNVWGDADYIAHTVYQTARKHLVTKHPEVVVNLDQLRGYILCGMQSGGKFTIEPVAKEPSS